MSIAQNSPPLSPKFSFQQSSNLSLKNPSMISTALWRSLAKQAPKPQQSLPTAHKALLCFCQRSNLYEISNPPEVGFSSNFVGFSDQRFGYVRNRVGFSSVKGYASVAEAVSTDASCSSSTDVEEEDVGDDLQHILKQMTKEERFQAMYRSQRRMALAMDCNTMLPLEGTRDSNDSLVWLGAAAVNLVAGEKPADVYSGIADRVLKIMQSDAQMDPAVCPEASRARPLLNQVNRKLVKQTVMTSVYGVTYIGARDQIKRRLKERGVSDDAELFGCACYAAKVTLTALGEMFEAARSIMSWLGDCARVIAAENEPVRWTTPLGLPVVQPYRKFGIHLVKTSIQVLTLQRETEKIMVKRQRTAFPPNFVHSLDGSHMMMTAVACKKAGLNFAGVHDSYWTHACDVDEMNRILREKFVELYETPVLENLLESFQQLFPELEFPPLPERGDFVLKDVLESPYFFN